jgi:hypothetical protein
MRPIRLCLSGYDWVTEGMVKSEGTGFRPYLEFLVRPKPPFRQRCSKTNSEPQNAAETPQNCIFPAN